MFFQKDYIMRMIEMMGDLMRRISELLDDISRMRLLDDNCLRHCGISLETAEALAPDSLRALLPPVPRLMMSELLYIRATALPLPTDIQEALLRKCLHLLASLWTEGELCEIRCQRLLELQEPLLPLLTSGELMDCARFFGEAEAFGHMEDAIFRAVERAGEEGTRDETPGAPPNAGAQELVAQGVAMLTTAAGAAPQALAFAGCTREELLLSAQELEERSHRP